MSGIFWEAEKQPDIVAAVSGYTFSTINLLVAIPMFLIDSVCSLIVAIISLACTTLLTFQEYATLAASSAAEALGIQDLEMEVTDYLLPGFLLITLIHSFYLVGPKSGGSWPQVLSRFVYYCSSVLLIVTFLSYSGFEDTTVYPRIGLLMISIQFIIMSLQGVTKEFSDFALEPPKTEFSSTVDAFLGIMGMESVLFLAIAAFGFPKFSGEDETSSYLCLVPFAAVWLLYSDYSRKKIRAPAPAPVANGDAVPVAEPTVVETVPVVEPTVVDEPEPVEEAPKGIEGVQRILSTEPESTEEPEVAVCTSEGHEPAAEEEANETVTAIPEPEPEEQTEDSVADDKTVSEIVEEIEDQIEAVADQIESAVETVVEKAKEVTEDLTDSVEKETAQIISLLSRLLSSISSLFTLIISKITAIISPVINKTTNIITAIINLPWFLIFLFVFCNGSQAVLVHTWLHLTGNPLAYLLPLTTRITPLVLCKMEAKIPQPCRGLLADLNGLAFVGIQYQLVSHLASASDE